MKKIYILAIIAFGFAFTSNAQAFDDDIESYPLGTIHTSPWGSWDGTPGTADDISVTDEESVSGDKSILVAEGGVIDGVLELGNVSSGIWYLDFNMLIPAGKSGYFNLQDVMPVGVKWNFHVAFNEGGTNEGAFSVALADGASQGPGTVIGTGTYTPGTWFAVSFKFDVDANTMDMFVDGTPIVTGEDFFGDTLGAINFFSNEGGGESNRYYIDDARFDTTPILGTNDFNAASFTVYPNPVKDVLNISSSVTVDAITVYDVLGKVVHQSRPDAISPSINMSALSSGAYLVQVTIGNATKTVKVVK
jgi:hypothetical protein